MAAKVTFGFAYVQTKARP